MNTIIEDVDDLDSLLNQPVVKEFVDTWKPEVLDQSYGYASSCFPMVKDGQYGMVQFFNKQVYMDGYLRMRTSSYAPEDVERHHRWKLFGYKIGRIKIMLAAS